MMVITRSGSDGACESTVLAELDALLSPLQSNIERVNKSLVDLRNLFEEKFTKQQIFINNLLTRITALEATVNTNNHFNTHIANILDRKLDDIEQFSRKINLRLGGIEVGLNDTPLKIMNLIKKEVSDLNLGIPDEEFDRCHRVGRSYIKNGRSYQGVLLKLCFWRTRDMIYQNRKKFSFKVSADLTPRPMDILVFAQDEIEKTGDMAIERVVDYVFCDQNCKLKLKSKSNKFYTFSSELELLMIVARMDHELCASIELMEDESNKKEEELNDVYY